MDTRDREPYELDFSEKSAPADTSVPDPGPQHSTDDPLLDAPVLILLPETKQSHSPFMETVRRFRRDTRAMLGVWTLVLLVLIALFGPPIYQHVGPSFSADLGGTIGPSLYHTYDHQELTQQNQLPSLRYWLGTDTLGRDLLARLMQGLLISLLVAFVVEVVNVSLGLLVGVLAGYYGGWIDMLLARFTDLIFSFPGLLFVILLTGIFGADSDDYFSNLPLLGHFLAHGNAPLVLVSLALSLVSWPLMARYVRAQTLHIKQFQFIEAARTSGTGDLRIMLHHIIPNLFSIVCIASTLSVSGTIMSEAGLSLLGLGVQPPGSSLGLMIADGAETIEVHPWNALFPALVLTLIVLSISFIGDGLRDAFDPHLKD